MRRNQWLTQPTRGSLWDFMSEMERTFDDLWTDPGTQRSTQTTLSQRFIPAVDLHETKDGYLMSFDLPGINESDIKIEVHDGRLTVHGERRAEHKEEREGGYRRIEKSYGKFERTFTLPPQIDEAKVQARFENGVLEILVPKGESAKPRTIQVEKKGGLFSRLLKGESDDTQH